MSNTNLNQNISLQATIIITQDSSKYDPLELSTLLKIDLQNLAFETITAEKTQSISVEQIREVIMEASKKSLNEKIRVFVFCEADKMKDVAQNSLLKILEEPPQGILLVLLTQKAEDILQTILSRCRVFKIHKNIERNINIFDEKFLLEKAVSSKEESKQMEKLVWKDKNLHENMLELQCIADKLSDSIDEQKLAKLWLFNLWGKRI